MNRLAVFWLCVSVLSGCKDREPETSYTRGSARIGASDAAYAITQHVADQYSDLYPEASVKVWKHSTQALIDSLVNQRADEIVVDRALSPSESAFFAAHQLKLFTYPIAHYPIYLLVDDSLAVDALDSIGLRRILLGSATSWQEFGSADVPITPYAPLPGDGAWNAIEYFFGGLDSVSAVVCSTNVRMMDMAAGDPGALLIYGLKLQDAGGFKKLSWAAGESRIQANAKTIMDSLRWPFMTTFTYATTHMKSDVAAGFLTFWVSNEGQKMVMREGYRPASVPVRMIQLKSMDDRIEQFAIEDTTS